MHFYIVRLPCNAQIFRFLIQWLLEPFLEKQGFINAETYSQRLEQEGRLDALKLDYPKKDLQFEQVENKPNILVITVSGLRYDALTGEKNA